MNANISNTNQYQQCIMNSKKVNWDIDSDVIRYRTLDSNHKFLPDSLSLVNHLSFLSQQDQRFISQIQGRSYAYIFALVERFINAKIMEMSLDHSLGDQVALQALTQFSMEELKHQELFRRIGSMADQVLPAGYAETASPNDVAMAVLQKSTWGVLALTCHIEIFTQVHYKQSIDSDTTLSPLFKDVFKYHWLEESQHATLDELEWQRIHEACSEDEVTQGVDDLIDLVVAVDGILQSQAQADTRYFLENCEANLDQTEIDTIGDTMLRAYRWQYIVSGVQVERFQSALMEKLTTVQIEKVLGALQPLINHVGDITYQGDMSDVA
ncbi:MAG: diiron oxygenase [Halioglobus sp.]